MAWILRHLRPLPSGRCESRENASQRAALSLLHKLEVADSAALSGSRTRPSGVPPQPCSSGAAGDVRIFDRGSAVDIPSEHQEASDPSSGVRRAQEGNLVTASYKLTSMTGQRRDTDEDNHHRIPPPLTAISETADISDPTLIAQGTVHFSVRRSLNYLKRLFVLFVLTFFKSTTSSLANWRIIFTYKTPLNALACHVHSEINPLLHLKRSAAAESSGGSRPQYGRYTSAGKPNTGPFSHRVTPHSL